MSSKKPGRWQGGRKLLQVSNQQWKTRGERMRARPRVAVSRSPWQRSPPLRPGQRPLGRAAPGPASSGRSRAPGRLFPTPLPPHPGGAAAGGTAGCPRSHRRPRAGGLPAGPGPIAPAPPGPAAPLSAAPEGRRSPCTAGSGIPAKGARPSRRGRRRAAGEPGCLAGLTPQAARAPPPTNAAGPAAYSPPRGLAASARRPGAGPCPSAAAGKTLRGHGCWGGTRPRSSLPPEPPLPRGGGDSRRPYRCAGPGSGRGGGLAPGRWAAGRGRAGSRSRRGALSEPGAALGVVWGAGRGSAGSSGSGLARERGVPHGPAAAAVPGRSLPCPAGPCAPGAPPGCPIRFQALAGIEARAPQAGSEVCHILWEMQRFCGVLNWPFWCTVIWCGKERHLPLWKYPFFISWKKNALLGTF